MQVNPSINLANLVFEDIMDITLNPHVCPNTTTNVNAFQVAHQNMLKLEMQDP